MSNETAAKVAPAVPRQGIGAPESTPESTPESAPAGTPPALPTGFDRPVPVPLDRLLAVATLTPGQAMLVAARLLHAGAASGTAGEGGTAGCRLGAVSLTSSGDIEVTVAPATDEETPVTELLRHLLLNARRLPAHPKPEQHLLLHRLEEAAASPIADPDARADGLEEALAATLGSGARRRLSAQLGSLVEAAAHVVSREPPAGGLPRGAAGPTSSGLVPAAPEPRRRVRHRAVPAPAGQNRAVRRSAHLSSRHRIRRVALVVAVLVAAIAASAYVGLLDRGAGLVQSLGRGNHPTATGPDSPARHARQAVRRAQAPHPRGVPTLAGRHAGLVAGVLVHKAGTCRPGSLCPVKVTVRLSAGSASRAIRWKVGTARLCKRQMAWAPPTTVTPRPGWRTVFASSSVRIPRGRALALVALTTAPTKVQSAPVPVTGAALHC